MKIKTKKNEVKSLRSLLALTLGILLVFAGFIGWQMAGQSNASERIVSAQERDTFKEEIILAVNNQRIGAGLNTLNYNESLAKAAQKKAENMVDMDYFSHIRPNDDYKWSDFIDAEKYNYRTAGENLAKGYTSIDNMINAWMNSPSHKENILSADYSETGIGISYQFTDQGEVLYVAEMFGTQY